MNTFTKPQVLAILRAALADSERAWLMCAVAYRFGLRASEVVAIKREDIRDGRLTVSRLKGSNRTTQDIPASAEPLLDLTRLSDYASLFPFGTPIFGGSRQQFWSLMQRVGKSAGVPADLCHPHSWKHAIAMHTIESAGIHRVRTHLGHKSIASTGEYLKETDDVASSAIAKALES